MSNASDPWIPGRGLSRLLAQENNISDVIQLLSDRDSSPWTNLVGFAPDEVEREARRANNADLLLTAGNQRAVIQVKLGHLMTAQQQERYEALKSKPDLYLAALASDEARIAAGSDRWFFLGLSDLVSRWKASTDPLARMLANETAQVLDKWDSTIAGVFASKDSETRLTLSALDQKFLARVATRRIAHDLAKRSRLVWSGVTNGGQAQVQAWAPIRGEGNDRAFMAEVRWQQSTPSGELRFGVDFGPRPGSVEDEEVRRAAYELARSMEFIICFSALKGHLDEAEPTLATLLRREGPSRPKAKGDWEQVIVDGFKKTSPDGGKRRTRRQTTPDFYGDGTLRFQAIANIDFDQSSAVDLVDLIDAALSYLNSNQP